MSLKLKYYLRGLGIGMAVTALFFCISGSKPAMTDDEVIARAKELGMTERTVLADFVEQESEESTEEESTEIIEEESEESQTEASEEESEEPQTEANEEKETIPEQEAEIASYAVIQVVKGDSSVTVSRKLAEVGLVENAEQFDKYLCKIHYDKKIRTGTFEIQIGSSEEEIAKRLIGE